MARPGVCDYGPVARSVASSVSKSGAPSPFNGDGARLRSPGTSCSCSPPGARPGLRQRGGEAPSSPCARGCRALPRPGRSGTFRATGGTRESGGRSPSGFSAVCRPFSAVVGKGATEVRPVASRQRAPTPPGSPPARRRPRQGARGRRPRAPRPPPWSRAAAPRAAPSCARARVRFAPPRPPGPSPA